MATVPNKSCLLLALLSLPWALGAAGLCTVRPDSFWGPSCTYERVPEYPFPSSGCLTASYAQRSGILAVNGSSCTFPSSWLSKGAFPSVFSLRISDALNLSLPEQWASDDFFASLVYLDIVNCSLEALPKAWNKPGLFPKLTNLRLSQNKFRTLEWLTDLAFPALEYLSLTNASIQALPGAWGRSGAFSRLQQLDLRSNQLRTSIDNGTQALPDEWASQGALSSLARLFLDTNSIEVLPEAWGNPGAFSKLYRLSLSHNKLQDLPKSLVSGTSFPKLQTLTLVNVSWEVLPDSWGQPGTFPELVGLELQSNMIKLVPRTWCRQGGMKKLQILDLSSNPLQEPPCLVTRSDCPYRSCEVSIAGTPAAKKVVGDQQAYKSFIKDYCLLDDTTVSLGKFGDSKEVTVIDGGRSQRIIGPSYDGNNLCASSNAATFLIAIWGGVIVLLLLSGVLIYLLRRRIEQYMSGPTRPLGQILKNFAHSVGGLLTVSDFISDLVLVFSLRGHWPVWVIAGSIALPFLVAAWGLTPWLSKQSFSSLSTLKQLGLQIAWPVETRGAAQYRQGLDTQEIIQGSQSLEGKLEEQRDNFDKSSWPFSFLKRMVYLPLAVPVVVLFDTLTILSRLGLQATFGSFTVGWLPYLESRTMSEVFLEALPQSILQSVVFIIGSSPVVGWYVDERVFQVSIALSVLGLLQYVVHLFLEAAADGKSVALVFRRRLTAHQVGPTFYAKT